jgi:hypothetical protein
VDKTSECPECGEVFPVTRRDKIYCSRHCKEMAQNRIINAKAMRERRDQKDRENERLDAEIGPLNLTISPGWVRVVYDPAGEMEGEEFTVEMYLSAKSTRLWRRVKVERGPKPGAKKKSEQVGGFTARLG